MGSAVSLSCSAVPSASSYRFAIEYLVSGNWTTYYTYSPVTDSTKFWPQVATSYRWRAAAVIGGVVEPYSGYATFAVH